METRRTKLARELANLEQEQRSLDLRDPNAITRYQQRVAELRREIALLRRQAGADPRSNRPR